MSTAERLLAPQAGEAPATNPDLTIGLALLDKRRPDYVQARQYFEDTAPEFFASPRLRRALERTGTAFKINFAAVPVKAAAQRIKIASVTCPDNADATAWIARQWRLNELDLYMPDAFLRACEYGDAYLMSWPVEDETDPEDDEEDLAAINVDTVPDSRDENDVNQKQVERPDMAIHTNLPLGMAAVYDEENPRRVRFYIRRWDAGDRIRVDLYYRRRTEKYQTKKAAAFARSMEDLVRFRDEPDDEWPYPNPYGQLPGWHLRTERPYGTPLHKPFYGAQDAIRKLIVSHMSIVDYQAARQRYALMTGDDTSEAADVDEDEFAIFDDNTGRSKPGGGLSANSQLEGAPDALWFMTGVREVGTFEEADPEVFLGPVERYMRYGAQASETPLRLFDYATARLPSGVSQDMADVPFNKKIEDLIASFRATVQAMWQANLAMAGFGPDIPVVVTFQPPERVSGIEGWKIVQAKIEAGMPVHQAFMEAGYTGEQVKAMFPEGEANLERRLTLLKTLAEILQALGAAATLQALSAEQITELVDAVRADLVAAVSSPKQDGDE
jgi:hypothetical protein